MKNITINKAANGYIVQAGCQIVVFESRERLITELSEYLSEPELYEKRFMEKYKLTGPPTAPYPEQTDIGGYRHVINAGPLQAATPAGGPWAQEVVQPRSAF